MFSILNHWDGFDGAEFMGDVFWMREISKKKRDGRGGSDDNYKSKYGAFGNETMAHIKYEGSSRRSYIFVFKQKNV